MPGSCLAQVYEFNVPTFGKGVVFDVDHKTRGEQFRFFAEALKSSSLKKYVPMFVQETQVGCPIHPKLYKLNFTYKNWLGQYRSFQRIA